MVAHGVTVTTFEAAKALLVLDNLPRPRFLKYAENVKVRVVHLTHESASMVINSAVVE